RAISLDISVESSRMRTSMMSMPETIMRFRRDLRRGVLGSFLSRIDILHQFLGICGRPKMNRADAINRVPTCLCRQRTNKNITIVWESDKGVKLSWPCGRQVSLAIMAVFFFLK